MTNEKYSLLGLENMGFPDRPSNLQALQMTNGDTMKFLLDQ